MLERTIALALTLAPALMAQNQDPSRGEVRLPCAEGWRASLVYDSGGPGIWALTCNDIQPQFACPEIIGFDDHGRATILRSYSGKWTPMQTVEDGRWLAAHAIGDLDHTRPGKELYAGGQRGHLYQIVARPDGGFDSRLIARFPGDEIHTLCLGDLDPGRKGLEMLVFLLSGKVHIVRMGENGLPTEARAFAEIPGRVRDALILPAAKEQSPWIATASRTGEVALYRVVGDRLEHKRIVKEPNGFGRVARQPHSRTTVLYATRDDGLVLRFEEQGDGSWKREIVYAGPQGPRGVVADRFFSDPDVESIAVFGYCKKVQLLHRKGKEAWKVETIFTEKDKGHWLGVGEVDGRNDTREILGSGYAGRIFLLSREPGYGLPDVATDPPAPEKPRKAPEVSRKDREQGVVRIGIRARRPDERYLTPLSYRGGFLTKTLLYETLVKRERSGRIVPCLAESWRVSEDGRTWWFDLRQDARFHDGKPVTASDVAVHFRRWVSLPEHSWLRCNRHFLDVVAESAHRLRIRLDRKMALLPELCAINPCAVVGPGARDREGTFIRPVGTGPYEYLGITRDGGAFRYQRVGTRDRVDLVAFERSNDRRPYDALMAGHLDAFVLGWSEYPDYEALSRIREDPRFVVEESQGSSLLYLSFGMQSGRTGDVRVRRALASIIDRQGLVDAVDRGHGEPCRTWAAPSMSAWPKATPIEKHEDDDGPRPELTILVREDRHREVAIAHELQRQCTGAGWKSRVDVRSAAGHQEALDAGDYDLRIERTWGSPYDPYLSLVARFTPAAEEPSAASDRYFGVSKEMRELVEEAMSCTSDADRWSIYGEVQKLIDTDVPVLPLYVPKRLQVKRRSGIGPRLSNDLYRFEPRG